MQERNKTGARVIEFLSSHPNESTIFGIAFLIRTLYAIVIQIISGAQGFLAFSDAKAFYYQEAINIAHHHVFSISVAAPYYPEAYHTPLYPVFIAFFLFLHAPLISIIIVQGALCALTAVLAYRIALLLSRSKYIALGVAGAISLEPMSIYWSGLLMSDVFFTFLFVAALYFLVVEKSRASLFVLGLSAMVRPISLYFMPLFLIMVLYQRYVAKDNTQTILTKVGIACALFILTISPWSIRDKVVFNTWSLSSAGWYLFYGFPLSEFASTYHVPVQPVTVPDVGADDFHRFSFEYTPLYKSAFFEAVSHNPIGFAIVYAKRSVYGLLTDRYEYLLHNVFASKVPGLYRLMPPALIALLLGTAEMIWFCVYILSIIAGFEKRLTAWWIFFIALFGLNLVFTAGINPAGLDMSRYFLPVLPLLFMFAGVGVRFLVEKVAQWRA